MEDYTGIGRVSSLRDFVANGEDEMELLDLRQGIDRRVFIKGLGTVGMGLLLSTWGGCESLCRAIRNRPIRRRLRTGSPEVDHVVAVYKDAVNLMRGLPSGDPRSWNAQAGLHGTVVPNAFHFCQHGTDHFFSWHRAYLLYFERICQELTGEKEFGLPYWNWNQDPAIHPEFTAAGSPLSHPRVSNTVAGSSAFSDSTLDAIFGDGNFFTFGSQIEGTPHNLTHVIVGADMVTGGSPQDPVFWAHHCMVDYCWAKWNIDLGNDNPNDPGWTDVTWDHFVDGHGDPVSVSAGLTTVMPLLSYQYESSTIGGYAARAARTAAELKTIEKRVRKGADIRFEIKRTIPITKAATLSLARPFSKATRLAAGEISALVESDRAKEMIFARVRYVKLPPTNDFFVRVFVNLPGADANTPTDDPHFAGSFAFFGTQPEGHEGHDEHHHKTEFLVYATDTLRRLRARGELGDATPISFQLVAVPTGVQLVRPEAEILLEDIDLIVSPVVAGAAR